MDESIVWIDTKQATPPKTGRYLVTTYNGKIDILVYRMSRGWLGINDLLPVGAYAVAWAHLPAPFNKEKINENTR